MIWALLVDDKLHVGEGAQPGITELAKTATCGVFRHPNLPPLFVAGPAAISWTVEGLVSGGAKRRFWRFELPPGVKLIVWPDGSRMGIGPTLESVELAEKALNRAG